MLRAALLALLALLFVVILVVAGGDETTQGPGDEQEDVVDDYGRERALDYISEGITFLALEYGIRLDVDVVRAMFSDDETLFADMGGGELLAFALFGWLDSPSEKADTVRDVLLEAGEVPSEVMQRIADRVAAYERKISKPVGLTTRNVKPPLRVLLVT